MPDIPPKNEHSSEDHVALAGVRAIGEMARQTVVLAPENQRVAALVVGVAGVIALLVGLALVPTGQVVWVVILVGLAFLLMAGALLAALHAVDAGR